VAALKSSWRQIFIAAFLVKPRTLNSKKRLYINS